MGSHLTQSRSSMNTYWIKNLDMVLFQQLPLPELSTLHQQQDKSTALQLRQWRGGAAVGKSRFQVPAATRKGNIGCPRCQSQEWEQMWKSNTGFQKHKLFICVLRKPIHRSSRPLSPRSSFLPNGWRVAIFFLVAVWVLAGWQSVGWAVQWPPGRWGQPGQGECLLPLIFSEWAP